jgi:DNA-binding transcriptional regulator GbsR (MarR family)
MGYLLLDGADAPEMCATLQVAKSSMSVALRRLEQLRLVERFRRSGPRRDRYRLTEDVFGQAFRAKMAKLEPFQRFAERGLEAVGDES